MLKKFAYMILALSAAAFAGNGHDVIIAASTGGHGEVIVSQVTHVNHHV